MIVTQTPLRISFAGGGTDLPGYYEMYGGKVVSCAIDKYIYVIVKERFDDMIYINYSKKEIVSSVDDIEHALVREALRITGIDRGLEITTLADIPSKGSGLGSSSSVTVGLLNALHIYKGSQVPPEVLADQACDIEINRCGKPIGKQDQYIAAFGGLREFNFDKTGAVNTKVIHLDRENWRSFQRRILMFFTGVTRSADKILSEQNSNIKNTANELHEIRTSAERLSLDLHKGKILEVGRALKEGWKNKKKLATRVTNTELEAMVEAALSAGADGAKISGAGGGGYLLVVSAPEKHDAIRESLAGYMEMPVKLERAGSRIVFNIQRDPYS